MRRSTSFDALIKLIDDPDVVVFEYVRNEILKNGKEIIPQLNDLLDYDHISAQQYERIEALVKELHFSHVLDSITKWCTSSEKDLLHGLQIISSYQFPDLTLEQLHRQVQNIQRRIWLEVNRRMTAFEIVERMNIMWYENIGLKVVHKNIATPFHTFINTAIEDLSGTPLATGLLYSIVAQRLNLPIYGVNFPDQFVLAYIDEFRIHQLIEPLGSGGVLFYLLPATHGKVILKKQLDHILRQSDVLSVREYFEPCSHSSLLILYLDELIEVYSKIEREQHVNHYQMLKNRILELA
jgi:hypothetical protein